MTVDPREHDAIRELLVEESLDLLPAESAAAVQRHVAECAECARTLAEFRGSVSAIGLALDSVEAPTRSAATRHRLLERARAERAAAGDAARVVPLPPDEAGVTRGRWAASTTAQRVLPWLAAASVVVAIASSAWGVRAAIERDRLAAALQAQIARDGRAIATRDSALGANAQTIAALTGASVQVIELASARMSAPWGRMFWDRATARWTFVAHRLPRLASGRTYQLWLVTPAAKISAGTFASDARGDAVVTATYALAADSLRAVAVTEEPAGGVPQPTGPMIVTGAATR